MVDSGASHHMCNDIQAFCLCSLCTVNLTIRSGDRTVVPAIKKATILIKAVSIEALFVTAFHVSLLSVTELDKLGCITTFSGGLCSISDSNDVTLLRNGINNGLYVFNPWEVAALVMTRSMVHKGVQPQDPVNTDSPGLEDGCEPTSSAPERPAPTLSQPPVPVAGQPPQAPVESSPATHHAKLDNLFKMWYRRFAHLHHDALPRARSGIQASGPQSSICDVCIRSKLQQKFEQTPAQRSAVPFELIHSDLAGTFQVSNGRASYYIIYVDDCARLIEALFLVGQSAVEICAKFLIFKASVEAKGFKIRRFRCDYGTGEYNNKEFLQALSAAGIAYGPLPPYTQQ